MQTKLLVAINLVVFWSNKTIHLEHFVESGHRHQKRVPAEVPDHVPW